MRDKKQVKKRTSIPFFTNWLQMVSVLPDDKVGQILKLCYQYTQTGARPELPEGTDTGVILALESFIVSETHNFEEWQESCKQKRLNRTGKFINGLRQQGMTDLEILAKHPQYADIIDQV